MRLLFCLILSIIASGVVGYWIGEVMPGPEGMLYSMIAGVVIGVVGAAAGLKD